MCRCLRAEDGEGMEVFTDTENREMLPAVLVLKERESESVTTSCLEDIRNDVSYEVGGLSSCELQERVVMTVSGGRQLEVEAVSDLWSSVDLCAIQQKRFFAVLRLVTIK